MFVLHGVLNGMWNGGEVGGDITCWLIWCSGEYVTANSPDWSKDIEQATLYESSEDAHYQAGALGLKDYKVLEKTFDLKGEFLG